MYTFEAGKNADENTGLVKATRSEEYPAEPDKGKWKELGTEIISPKRLAEIARNNPLNGKPYHILARNCQTWSVSPLQNSKNGYPLKTYNRVSS